MKAFIKPTKIFKKKKKDKYEKLIWTNIEQQTELMMTQSFKPAAAMIGDSLWERATIKTKSVRVCGRRWRESLFLLLLETNFPL